MGAGFVISSEEADFLLRSNENYDLYVRPYFNGRDVAQQPRGSWVVDLERFTEDKLRKEAPDLFQIAYDRVKPFRENNNEEYRRINWWKFGRQHGDLIPTGAKADSSGIPKLTEF
ncbi:hypothetical protein [Aurantimonas sp. A3-2-R12]|uniref:hypothetical protein n=1 Tax=Aurantimonas sp. A3-2-R12 TaxID=3114362 RepID=UPI002E19D958|nr:hypothetical protein [Aurantimonas sp. A3-2-R12]